MSFSIMLKSHKNLKYILKESSSLTNVLIFAKQVNKFIYIVILSVRVLISQFVLVNEAF